jgi:hypothetical protein
MKLPRGFGKNYFSLSAITATVNAISLKKEAARVQKFHRVQLFESDEAEELAELELLEPICFSAVLQTKACHCNCFFLGKTKKSLKLFALAQYDTPFYSIYYTDSSPPVK